MMQNWTKKYHNEWRWLKISQKYEKDIINAYVYVEKLSSFYKLFMAYNIG